MICAPEAIRSMLYMFEYQTADILVLSWPRKNRNPPPAEYHWLVMKNSDAARRGLIRVGGLMQLIEDGVEIDRYQVEKTDWGREAERIGRFGGFWDTLDHCFAEQHTITHFSREIARGTMSGDLKNRIMKSNEEVIRPVQEALMHAMLKA